MKENSTISYFVAAYVKTHRDWSRFGRSGLRIPGAVKDVYIFQNVHTGSRAHPVGTGVLFREQSGRGVVLTTNPHLAPRLKKE
jgi:hypothetical protein